MRFGFTMQYYKFPRYKSLRHHILFVFLVFFYYRILQLLDVLVFVHALFFHFFPLAIFQARIFAKFFFLFLVLFYFYFFTGSSWEKVF